MPDLALVFSFFYFFVFIVYFYFAVYINHINEKARLNRTFFAICASLCLWSLGFALSISAPDAATALFWKRFSAIGWGTVYCLILHFLMILTDKDTLFKKWWFRLVFYIPAALNIFLFSLSNTIAAQEYQLIQAHFGWTSPAHTSIWDIFFYVYYISYTLIGLFIVWNWKRNSTDKSIHRQAYLIMLSIFATLLIGTLTDVIAASKAVPILPQMAPIEIILPISVFYYLVKRFGLMAQEKIISTKVLMSDATRKKLYTYLMAFIVTLSLFSFFYTFLGTSDRDLLGAVYRSTILLALGLVLLFIQRIKHEATRFSLNTVVILLSIPIVSLLFIPYGTMMSWIFPIILIIFSYVFNRRIFLISITTVATLMQTLLWLYTFNGPYHLSVLDFAARILFYAVLFVLGLYVNSIYVSKLKETSYQIELQKLISDISYDFACANSYNMNDNINRMLERIGLFFHADRSFIFLFDHEHSDMNLSHEWCHVGISPEIGQVKPCPLYKYPSFIEDMGDHKTVYQIDCRKLQNDFITQNNMFIDKNIITFISSPVETNGTMYGFIGFSSIKAPLNISESSLEIIQTFANLLADKFMMLNAESAIEYLAFFDQLTGLPNRLMFNDRTAQAIHLAKRHEKALGIIFINLDSFKSVNETMGHTTGDEIIKEVANILLRNLRKSDTVARFGGDEFLILLNDIADCRQIPHISSKIMSLFEAPIKLHDQEYFIMASAGVAIFPFDGEDHETLIKNADIALFKAKAAGGSQIVVCTPEMKDEVITNMMLSNSLYRALDRNELLVYYQPQVCLRTGSVIGFEALLRWNHPELGMISPALFIPLAEKNGLINKIGEWVLRVACLQNKKWQEIRGHQYRMSVNISVVQFRNPKLVDTIETILKETGLSPSDLELEITESVAINESTYLSSVLNNLNQLGITISIDDFGTEYSSLNRLKELPIDRIKIDMRFVQELEQSLKDQAIALTIISLAKNLGLQVIAEGVETTPQLSFLKSKECDIAQGYYFYRPMPPETLDVLLDEACPNAEIFL